MLSCVVYACYRELLSSVICVGMSGVGLRLYVGREIQSESVCDASFICFGQICIEHDKKQNKLTCVCHVTCIANVANYHVHNMHFSLVVTYLLFYHATTQDCCNMHIKYLHQS